MVGSALLVEGPSDVNAVVALAEVLGVELAGVEVIDLGGITNVRRGLAELPDQVAAGVLHDAGEADHVHRVLADADREVATFECVADLEDELIRALGLERALAVVAEGGDFAAWRTISRQPFHRDRQPEQVLRRFLGAGSGRKKRYGGLLAAALGPDEAPAPLVAALTWATRR